MLEERMAKDLEVAWSNLKYSAQVSRRSRLEEQGRKTQETFILMDR
jgi:hypothetical protein